jgi:recombinational DNA repair ATPase RecF
MKTECDSVIANANQVINQQKSSLDTLWKIRDKWIKSKVSQNRLSVIDKEIADLVTITSNIELIKKHLEAIKTFANVGEKVNKRMIYYKRTYINYSTTIQVHDENIMIQEITEGLSAKKYISKYLPDHKPAGKL